ncbi:hypothetical protein HJG60_009388 [Phyllostomus discolor]|uniref:Uncharacterized protein n=1 Tax=Phyllostomus discolor TaxID=89673 RepID=A0A833YJL6_9CHIR|nr:hypothetical protein HJG60_009388 [Phyllostomus discolor]
MGEGPRLPCCASSAGTPRCPDEEQAQGWSGVVRVWEDLAELSETPVRMTQGYLRARASPGTGFAASLLIVSLLLSTAIDPLFCLFPNPGWTQTPSITLASFPNEYFLCSKGCYQSFGTGRFLIRSVIFLAKAWKTP